MTRHSTQKEAFRKNYDKELQTQAELCKLQAWVKHRLRVIIFERSRRRRKGGTIRALTERSAPVFRRFPPAPSDHEFLCALAALHGALSGRRGRSRPQLHNRAGVEHNGLCTEEQHQDFKSVRVENTSKRWVQLSDLARSERLEQAPF
jgi:hypothetical protein